MTETVAVHGFWALDGAYADISLPGGWTAISPPVSLY
jgi:hypothetical protein